MIKWLLYLGALAGFVTFATVTTSKGEAMNGQTQQEQVYGYKSIIGGVQGHELPIFPSKAFVVPKYTPNHERDV